MFAATLLIVVCLIVKLFLATETSATLVVGIVLTSGFLILSPRLFELAELRVSKDGLVAKIQDVERKVERTEKDVRKTEKKIDYLFAYAMSNSMFGNLRKLATGRFGHFRNNGGLLRELRHLRDVGYIEVKGHIGNLPTEGPNLSDYVTVTPVGSEFVTFRKSLDMKADELQS